MSARARLTAPVPERSGAGNTVVSVLATLVKPRWIALLILVLLAATVMAGLGQWQFSRARQESVGSQRSRFARTPVELTAIARPQTLFPSDGIDRPVTVSGTWRYDEQVLVADQRADATRSSSPKGYWLLMALQLADGSEVAVLRGWSADARTLAAPATAETATVTGVLRISDAPVTRDPGTTAGLPAGQLEGVDLTELIKVWPEPLYTGYVVGSASSVPTGYTVVSPLQAGSGLAWRNISYALQWWLFAAFGLFLWARLVRDDHLGRLPSGPPRPPRPVPADQGVRS